MGTIFVDSVTPIPQVTRPRGRWPLVGLLAALALLAAFTWPEEPDVALVDPPAIPGCESGRPQLTIPVLDVSSSVINPDGADPAGRSFEESRLLVRSLLVAACDVDDKFGAIAFADRPLELVPPTPLTDTALIDRSLRAPSEALVGGGTDIVAAMEAVALTLRQHPNHETIVVLLSDMVGSRSGASLDSKLASTLADHLHLVALGDHLPDFDSRFDSVVKIDAARPGAVAQALADAVAASRANSAPQPSR